MLALLAFASTTIALAVNETPTASFGASWAEAKRIGICATTMALDWSRVEPRKGEFDLSLPRIAEGFYPREGAEVGLVLRDLNTNRDERPTDLRGLAYDDPAVLRRWTTMADAVLRAMPTVRLSWIAVGNEVDGILTDSAKVGAYARFLKGAYGHLRHTRSGVPLGTPLTFDGVRGRAATLRPLLEKADAAMVNYYLTDGARRPAKAQVPKDLDAMAAFAGNKPLRLTEAGAPSGSLSGSSEAAQAQFVSTLIDEARRRRIASVALQWTNDVGTTATDGFARYYGVDDPSFRDTLATLGLRHADGTPKPAWAALARALPP